MAPSARWALVAIFCTVGCAPTSTEIKSVAPAPVHPIRRVTVIPFEGTGGVEATDQFIRELVGMGVEVTDAKHPGDAILRGIMTEYKSSNQLMVFLGNTTLMTPGGQTIVVDNPIVSLAGAQAVPDSPTQGTHHQQVASIVASVAINARLLSSSNKEVLWTGSMAYEGLDLPETLQRVSHQMVDSLAIAVPSIRKRPS